MKFINNNANVFVTVVTVNLVAFIIGTIFSWPSPALLKLNGTVNPYMNPLVTPITITEGSWLASINLIGACFGSTIAMLIISRIGRKRSMTIMIVPCIVGFLLLATTGNLVAYMIARFLCGVTLGAGYQIVPPYVAEISPVEKRGVMGCFYAIFIAMGQIFVFAVGPITSFQLFNFAMLITPAVAMVLIYVVMYDSPYHYVAKNNLVEAERVLIKMRASNDVTVELKEIIRTVEMTRNQVSLSEIFSSQALRKSLLIAISIVIFQQLAIINPVISYMQPIFHASGSDISPQLSSVYVGLVQLVGTIIIPQFIDKFGRKILIVGAQFMVFVSLTSIGVFFFLQERDYNVQMISWLPLASLITYIIFFNMGVGSTAYVVIGEIFPENAKNLGMTLTTLILTGSAFIILFIFPFIEDAVGTGFTFWLFASACFISSIFFYIVLPETKNKTFIEIQNLLVK